MTFGMKNPESRESLGRIEYRRGPEFAFTSPNTLLFLTGVPLSGKSTIAPIVASSIEGCAQQSTDIVRLFAQEIEARKPENERNPFVKFGSCDSYLLIGDGSYSPESLIQGFKAYSEVVVSILRGIIPKLETQGVRNVLFEGVQLTPTLVAPFLGDSNKLIIVESNESKLRSNFNKRYGENQELQERYSVTKLLLLQNEILRQSKQIPSSKVMHVNNSGNVSATVLGITSLLLSEGVIRPK